MGWEDLPATVRGEIEAACGTIQQATPIPAGLTAGTAVRLDTNTGPVFVKALPADSPSAALYLRELHVNAVLPATVPGPRVRWSGQDHGWVALAFDHIAARRPVDLGPASPDVADLMELVAVLGDALTPNPAADVPPVADNVMFLLRRADALLADPPPDLQALPSYQAARAGLDLDALAGCTLLHADLHEGNLIAADRLQVIDWGLACHGAAWVETALLIPRLIAEGH
ncbi:MAG: aminoglycoside phosphotransferase, partial [Nocardioides sp.]|nr:aminoglycoside phosphotransferase [Nocardioides sp.]